LFDIIIIGIINGCLYALIAAGIALLYGVMGVVNFAHGDIFAMAGYITLITIALIMPNSIIALVLCFLFSFLLGIFIDRFTIAPLRRKLKPEAMYMKHLIVTLGLSILFQNILLAIFGANPQSVPDLISGKLVTPFINISYQRLLIVGSSAGIMISLFTFLQKTKLGMAIRAVSQNVDVSQSLGINVGRIYSVTFGISAALASVAGYLASPIIQVYPTAGAPYLLRAFAVVILGGMSSISGAMAGAFIIGILEAFTVMYIRSELKMLVTFLVIIIVLIVRPKGLLVKR
jgi:branched-chain amino acid transport system permease protein